MKKYTIQAITTVVTNALVCLSIIYILLIFGVAFIAGFFNLRGIAWGLVGFCIYLIVIFLIALAGSEMSTLIPMLVLAMFYIIAPFVPITDTINQFMKPQYGYAIILIPIFSYLLSLSMYNFGRKIRITKNHYIRAIS